MRKIRNETPFNSIFTINRYTCFSSPALAQTSDFTIKVTPQEADVLWAGLRELPVKIAEPVMNKLRQQIVEQTKPPVPISPNTMGK